MMRMRWIGVLIVIGLNLGAAVGARAGYVYEWTDRSGTLHFSNANPPRGVEARPRWMPDASEPAAGSPDADASEADARTGDVELAQAEDRPAGKYGSLSDEEFSRLVSRRRDEIRRSIREKKSRIGAAREELATLAGYKDAARERVAQYREVVTDTAAARSPEEMLLEREVEALEDGIGDLRKDYESLRSEAIDRYGRLPAWWIGVE